MDSPAATAILDAIDLAVLRAMAASYGAPAPAEELLCIDCPHGTMTLDDDTVRALILRPAGEVSWLDRVVGEAWFLLASNVEDCWQRESLSHAVTLLVMRGTLLDDVQPWLPTGAIEVDASRSALEILSQDFPTPKGAAVLGHWDFPL